MRGRSGLPVRRARGAAAALVGAGLAIAPAPVTEDGPEPGEPGTTTPRRAESAASRGSERQPLAVTVPVDVVIQEEPVTAVSIDVSDVVRAMEPQPRWVDRDAVNVRAGAGTQAPVLRLLTQDEQVVVDGELNGWYRLQDGGFVRADLMTDVEPVPAQTAAASGAAVAGSGDAVAVSGDAVAGSPRAIGQRLAAERGWTGHEWDCLEALWTRESGWNPAAHNRSSGAHGIPQALPGAKMASAGADWATNPVTQIRWGLDYIAGRYGSPSAAWAHSERVGWY